MSVPAGWYDDGSGRQRWWDGERWTEHFAPVQPETPTETPTEMSAPQDSDAAGAYEEDLDATVRREDVQPAAADALSDAPAATEVSRSAESAPAGEDITPDTVSQDAFERSADVHGAPTAAENASYPAPAAPETAAFAPPAAPGYAAPATPAYGDPSATSAYPAAGYPGGARPYGAPAYGAPAYGAEQPAAVKPPILGFIGLGLAVVGTILACIPPVLTGFGFFLLFAAFVVSLIAIFMKTKKWPAIVGLALSVVGGIVGGVLVVVYFVNFANTMAEEFPSDFPTSITSEGSSDDTSDEPSATGRPSPDEIAAGFLEVLHEADITDFDDPEVSACVGQFMYDSELSDETLQTIAGGEDVYGAEGQTVQNVTADAIVECAAQ